MGAMIWALLGLVASVSAVHTVNATGGGVVKPGTDLVLTYNVGKPWDRCYWFW